MPADTAAPRPDVFVVGAAKAGTTSLYRMLEQTERVGLPRLKELHYFSGPELLERTSGPGDDWIRRRVIRDEAAYLAEFAHLPRGLAAVVDISPSYIEVPAAADRIRAFAPEGRIIMILREPAAKVYSQYVHLWSGGNETLPFAEAFEQTEARRAAGFSNMFDYAGGGAYAAAVERFLEAFGPDRVLVLIFEQLFAADAAERDRLGDFLGLALPAGPPPRVNAAVGRVTSPFWSAVLGNQAIRIRARRMLPSGLRGAFTRSVRPFVQTEAPAPLDPAFAARLRRHYAADVARLEALIGRPTGWPRPDTASP